MGLLNDSSTFWRSFAAASTFPLGVLLAIMARPGDARWGLLFAGLFVYIAVIIAFCSILVVSDRRLRNALEAATTQLAARAETGLASGMPRSVAGTLVRDRAHRPSAGGPRTPAGMEATRIGIFNVATTDGPRRVVALIPPLERGTQHQLVLHPDNSAAAILDDRPRTRSGPASPATSPHLAEPTDQQVAGGYAALFGMAVLGLMAGMAVAGAVIWLG